MGDLLELAARVEALKGPDREVDLEILKWSSILLNGARFWNHDKSRVRGDDYSTYFTASLDAAMTLVPEGAYASMGQMWKEVAWAVIALPDDHEGGEEDGMWHSGDCKSMPLALCAAALRAQLTAATQRAEQAERMLAEWVEWSAGQKGLSPFYETKDYLTSIRSAASGEQG